MKEERRRMRRINIYIGGIHHLRLMELSEQTGLSLSEHVRRAVDDYLKSLGMHTYNIEGWRIDKKKA